MGNRKGPRVAAYGVHVLTSTGAVLGFLALLAVFAGDLTMAFVWLGIALFVDAVDGPLARRLGVKQLAQRYSGDVLDLVVDYLTYVIVPAAIIARGGLLPAPFDLIASLAVMAGSALYFADNEMKTDDWWFRGFPAVWNVVAFYLAVFTPPGPVAVGVVAILTVMMFLPIPFVHPLRVVVLRPLTLAMLVVWIAAAGVTLLNRLAAPTLASVALAVTAFYFVAIGFARRPTGETTA